MYKTLLGLLLLVLGASAGATPAPAGEPRLALVIGNNDYRFAPLLSPINDARAMTDALERLGFHVISLENATASETLLALREFTDTLAAVNGLGLFYYAGHGVQIDGHNYLIPTVTDLRSVSDVRRQSLRLDQVLATLGRAGNRANLMIIDACRDNPYAGDDGAIRAGLAPLARATTPGNTLVAFATAPGMTAIDGDDHGLFTRYLLAHLSTPELPVEQLFKRVRRDVIAASAGRQIPWENSSLTSDVYFNPPSASATPPAAQPLLVLSTEQLRLEPPVTRNVRPAQKIQDDDTAERITTDALDRLLVDIRALLNAGQLSAAKRSLEEAYKALDSATLNQIETMTRLTRALTRAVGADRVSRLTDNAAWKMY